MVIGGQAVLVYGEPRLTRDIDITLGLEPEYFQKIHTIVKKLSLSVLVDDLEPFIQKTAVFPAMDDRSGIRIDFIFSFSEYEKQALYRVNTILIERTNIHFASLEDVVIHKIVAGRPRDLEDIKSILLKNPRYDKEYIISWLTEFGKSLDIDYTKLFQKIIGEINRH